MKTGLVLEGGGMRGLYTVGVLDALDKQDITFDYVIGVSAGACNGASFVSGQKGRNYRVNTEYLGDKRYVSMQNYIRTGSMFGMDFIFDEIPHHLDPFDYEAFQSSGCEFTVGVTDVATGKPAYFGKEDMQNNCTILRASSSIPGFAPMIPYQDKLYLDGGTSDPIPAKKAIEDGCDKLVVVLTRDRTYRKKPQKFRSIYKRLFRKYPRMTLALDVRHQIYNDQLKYVHKLESEGKALIIAPTEPLTVSRFEKAPEKLKVIYQLGLENTHSRNQELLSFLG